MTFNEFCNKYPHLKVTRKDKGCYYFLVEENNDKFIYCFSIDKVQYIKNNIVDGKVRKVEFEDFVQYNSDYCMSRTIEYEYFLKLYDAYYGQIVCYSNEGEIIIPTEDDLHNYKYFYINGKRFCFSKDGSRIVKSCDPLYCYKTYTKKSFEDDINVNDLL